MRSKASDYFEVKLRYTKLQENGKPKDLTERYVIEAVSWDEAEKKTAENMRPYVSGDYQVKSILPANYHEIFFSDKDEDDKWYKVKLSFITIDEKTQKEKLSNITYLVQAKSFGNALKNVKEVMDSTMIDYVILGINETNILDVFENNNA